ncbi:prepilin-type N-terminal cleavage/methylation domain-containing protein [Clostridium sp. YIM B02515]|uniref:Prepilin-type N-terminal cleavage/methylation domain-containing protein n=1 Tax=Clostridium rhizosphaerae TaxID=2803861 RepID=A0ABS1TCW2_9CLOT|nr:prepilin-type N-terminal cleavage/methylation domain-containing protein [Clostridium rhizosphaerae]MBL4937199.1 prepilin-type N-terminal cleavage/methylation domain-containing protein [Clostridium rhizosphaerae]
MRKKGFTLIELLAVIAIMGIVFVIIYSIYSSSQRIYNTGYSQIQIQNSARKAVNAVSKSINDAQSVSIVSSNASNITIDDKTFSNIPNLTKSLLYVNPADNSAEPYLYVIENSSELHRVYTSGTDELITTFIDYNNTTVNMPIATQHTYSIKFSVKYGSFSESYTTYSSINNGG